VNSIYLQEKWEATKKWAFKNRLVSHKTKAILPEPISMDSLGIDRVFRSEATVSRSESPFLLSNSLRFTEVSPSGRPPALDPVPMPAPKHSSAQVPLSTKGVFVGTQPLPPSPATTLDQSAASISFADASGNFWQ
jgi:hypothetical protein